jgi:hypothetical protein
MGLFEVEDVLAGLALRDFLAPNATTPPIGEDRRRCG